MSHWISFWLLQIHCTTLQAKNSIVWPGKWGCTYNEKFKAIHIFWPIHSSVVFYMNKTMSPKAHLLIFFFCTLAKITYTKLNKTTGTCKKEYEVHLGTKFGLKKEILDIISKNGTIWWHGQIEWLMVRSWKSASG